MASVASIDRAELMNPASVSDRLKKKQFRHVKERAIEAVLFLAASLSVFAEVSRSEQRRLFSRIPVRELMHDAVTVGPDTQVRDAARILIESNFGCLPVVDAKGALVGIVTEADFLRLTVRLLDAIQA